MKLPFTVFPGCTAVDSLSRQTDRRIDDRHMALARAWDAAHPVANPARVNIVNVRPSRDIAMTLLCDAMLRAWTLNGCVTAEDLARTGLPADQIAGLAPTAAIETGMAMAEQATIKTAARCLDDHEVAA